MDEFKEELLKAICSGCGTDWAYDIDDGNGGDEYEVETFDPKYALQSVLEVLYKHGLITENPNG
jgi:hypothetical protein